MSPRTPATMLICAAGGLAAGFILHSPIMAIVTGVGLYVLMMVVRIGRGR